MLFFLLLLNSCASNPAFESEIAPNWLTDVKTFCGEKYLCAAGEGKNLKLADATARSELAKIFQTQITSELKSSEMFQTGSEVKENYLNEITESSELTLENVKILEHWKRVNSNEVYALAGLDRKAAQNKILEQLNPLLSELKTFFDSSKRSDLIRAKKIYPKIQPLITQWRIVSETEFNYSPKEGEFVSEAIKKFDSLIEVDFFWDGNSALKITIKNYLKDLLTKSGYQFGLSAKKYLLKGSIQERDLPIKLKNYLKKEFELNIDVYFNEKLIGNIHHNFKTSGRNWGQLSERARLIFMKVIFENLENLNIN